MESNLSTRLESMTPENRNALLLEVFGYLAKTSRLELTVFEASLKTKPNVSFELITLLDEERGREAEVLLVQRGPGDINYPGMYHTPGKTVINRAPSANLFSALAKADESGIPITEPPPLAGVVYMPNNSRGHYVALIFVRRLTARPEKHAGQFVPVSRLNEYRVIRSHGELYLHNLLNPPATGAFFVESLEDMDV